ncbi:hypothetical protein MASR1M31_03460 [Porphyromonadaceae bacterium]
MLYNIQKQDVASKTGTPKYRIYLAHFKDVDVENFPTPTDATISATILKTGKKFIYLDATSASIKPNVQPGESPSNGKILLTPFIEGVSKKTLAWIYANAGEDVVCVWERCSDKQKFIAGSACSGGLKLKYSAIGPNDAGIEGIALSMEGGECPEPFYFYEGPLEVEADEVETPPAG